MLMGLEPIYIYPPQLKQIPVNGGISVNEIEELLIENKDIRLVVITSPSYEGVVSDILKIAEAVHRQGALLLVDEAHGAHFGFHESFPKSAVTLGADLVIQSLHKTLPSFTQTAVLHSNREDLNNKLQKFLAVYQSSSPSYLLMAGMDRCISMLEDEGRELFDTYSSRLNSFYRSVQELKRLKCTGRELLGQNNVYDLDPSKITISVMNAGNTGAQLAQRLRNRYHIEMEMTAPEYVLGMTSICDTQEGFDRLAEALLEIDREYCQEGIKTAVSSNGLPRPLFKLLPSEAAEAETEAVNLMDSAGRISAAFISQFLPGSPLIVPGEILGEELISYIRRVIQEGISVTGLTGEQMDEIEVIKL
jgi:arginine/lysine/ornithine decarboxylase